MERMAVSVATGVLSSLLSKLSVLLSDKYKKLKGVRRDIESLSRELTDMNAALVKLADREKLDVQTKVWRDKVREMAYDIEDIIDIFMHHHDQAGDDKDGLFQKTARKIRKLRARFQIAGMIQDIKARVEEQSKSRDRYKVEESISQPRVVEVDPRLPAMYEDAKRLVGIDGPREEIIRQLMEEDDSKSGGLKVLSIVGFGGLGKTTLANQVYAKIKNEFECTGFVSVSRTPDIPKILKDILSEVEFDVKEMGDDVKRLVKILREQLTNKRLPAASSKQQVSKSAKKREENNSHKYFVIIDDLWSIKDWDIIKCAFVENNNGSRLITTTRIQDVATASCIPSQGHVYQMQPLNEIHSRRLFFKRLFGLEDSCPEQFREICNQMLRKCKGVPLAITSIASLLANSDFKLWEQIHDSMGSELDTNPTLAWMSHVLGLSYNDLSHELKTCLLYLGMYPEDYKIPKEALVRKWIAEGFVRERYGLDLEEAAKNCFNKLINRNMIQPCFREDGSGEVWACQVHDLMLDLIISKCKEENFITIIDKNYPMNGVPQLRRISHQFNNRDTPLAVESISASTVRTYNTLSIKVDDMPLSKFEFLRVLDMDTADMHMHHDLSAINHLFLLRYVRVRASGLILPEKFGKLKHLVTLDISTSWSYDAQLSDFNSLSSLRHLSLPRIAVMFKNGLSKLCNLRDLSGFYIDKNSTECIRDLGELTNLRNLEVGYYSFPPDPIDHNRETILAASLMKLGNNLLCHLSFCSGLSWWAPSAQFCSDCLTAPQHLQNLILYRVLMPKLPDWIAYADRLAHVVVAVQELRNDDVRMVLGQLRCLIHLDLTARTIPDKSIIILPKTFHSLKHFRFCSDELPRLTFKAAAMPQLQRLKIEIDARNQGAMQLQEGSPVGGIEHLASLEEISLYVPAKCGQGSKIESACRDAISRHPKSQVMKIDVSVVEWNENGQYVRTINNTGAGTSGED